MIRNYLINRYLGKEFLKIVLNTSLIFFGLGIVMSLFEQINFFKDFDVSFALPITQTLLFVPSLLKEFFPFVILISGIWFFLKIKKTQELTAINTSGISNFYIIIIPSILSFIIGIFFITSLNPITSSLIKKYESIKGVYEKDQDYLAAITENGIWIKEKNYIIRSSHLKNKNLMEVTIYEMDDDNNFTKRIEAESADITSLIWILKNVKIINSEGSVLSENIEQISYNSIYDIEKLKTLYSNVDTISFWNLGEQIKLYEERGYSTKEMEIKLHKSFSFPFFLLSMLILSAFFTLGTNASDNNWTYVFLAIISSILIFFFNDFSSALGKTERLPVKISVWIPTAIVFLFSFVGIIHANQK
jgi:lipopolysaccharide export system permease protein